MIKNWNEMCGQIETCEGKISEFMSNAGLSSLQLKKLQKYLGEWNKLKKMAEVLDQFIAPVDPIQVESPFDQEDFRYIWKTWKEYLQEQHGKLMKTRMEQMALDYLTEISDNDPDLAISYLRYAMANGYRSFFKVEANTKVTPPKTEKDGSDW